MRIRIDSRLPTPVYVQIADQLRESIVLGRFVPGHRLPSVRRLGADLDVNYNTVASAYRLLEEDGFVRLHPRFGAEVVAPSTEESVSRRKMLTAELRKAVVKLRQAGVSVAELRRIANAEITAIAGDR